ncbi:MAG: hypothetical protein E7414_05905 [Ruminococcaceae bacterium]|nr:hypothetical protein [Oscillospiraceae bacterium]
MKMTKKITALALAIVLMLSMATVALAAETKTLGANGTDYFSVSGVANSYIETWEEEGESVEYEVLECEAPVTVTMLTGDARMAYVMDHTYEIETGDTHDTGYIMPDGCPSEKEYWETDTYRDYLAAGTTFTLTEPGSYSVNLDLGDDVYFEAFIEVAGEREKDAANFTKAYYQQRQENAATDEAQAASNLMTNGLIDITNVIKEDGTINLRNDNTGEIAPIPVYACLGPIEITAKTDISALYVMDVEEGQESYVLWRFYLADNEGTEEEFDARYENQFTPAGTKYTMVGSESNLYYLHASGGSEEINVVLRIDGPAPININQGKRDETIEYWSEIPNGSVTLSGVYDITYDDWGDAIYVIDRDSTITFNSYLSDYFRLYESNNYMEEFTLQDNPFCTPIVCETTSYMDNLQWYDEESEMELSEQYMPGLTLQFNKIGKYGVYFTPGYASREERIGIQFNDNSNLGWQYSPTITVWVIDPAPQANYTASKVIVNGVETEFEAYNIHDNNYFKLRDIAMAINGSEKQFGVYWDGEKSAISLMSGHPYTPVGGELATGDGTSKASVMTTSTIYKDEKPVSLGAYNINDNNYFKLRDLGEAFDFDVTWDAANSCIMIDTTSSYTAD